MQFGPSVVIREFTRSGSVWGRALPRHRRVCYVLLRWFQCTTPCSVCGVRVVLRRRCSGTSSCLGFSFRISFKVSFVISVFSFSHQCIDEDSASNCGWVALLSPKLHRLKLETVSDSSQTSLPRTPRTKFPQSQGRRFSRMRGRHFYIYMCRFICFIVPCVAMSYITLFGLI